MLAGLQAQVAQVASSQSGVEALVIAEGVKLLGGTILSSIFGNSEDEDRVRGLADQQSRIGVQLNESIRDALSGRETGFTRKGRQDIERFQRGERQSQAASRQRRGIAGTTTGLASRQEEQFQRLILTLLSGAQQNAFQAAGQQAGQGAATSLALANQERADFAAFGAQLGRLAAGGDNTSQRMLELNQEMERLSFEGRQKEIGFDSGGLFSGQGIGQQSQRFGADPVRGLR